ncbi:MAG: hypothetical protein JXR46_06720 [Calditrichaceae bacterium]|nr:hypothetical protein [Calditrichaceae bacterium]MBN2708722.1 hypothetical protein [Calditrichaceae bacterium]RQV92155.1 MAG: hypothetical protein EH224_16380 [Calditrichota bacterium]
MYISHIGRRFLEIYKLRTGIEISPKEFFIEKVFNIFYNHPKYFKWVVNSPLVQKLSGENKKKVKSFSEEQKLKLTRLVQKIENDTPDSSFVIGYPSADLTFDTSGQVSNIRIPSNQDDIYYSWIGAGFGIEVEGKQVWYIDNEKILWNIFEGWDEYRKHLNSQVINIKGNEIDAWNSIWLNHLYDEDRIIESLMINEVIEIDSNKPGINVYKLKGISWINMMFILSKVFPGENLNIYSTRYVFDKQKFITLGFMNLILPDILQFIDFYKKVFGESFISIKKIKSIYETEYSFQRACENGVIGLRAIMPKDLKKYMHDQHEKKFPKLNKDQKSIINYTIYQTWIIAMLNNKELLNLAEQSAKYLKSFVKGEKQTKTKRPHLVENLLSSRNRQKFVDNIISIVQEDSTFYEYGNELVNKVMVDISSDNIPLFVTLLRFKYLEN